MQCKQKKEKFKINKTRVVVSSTISYSWSVRKILMLKGNFYLMRGKFVAVPLLFKILEILLESEPFKTSRNLPYFERNSFIHA